MASDYTISDQAADLGIHRVHSLVLGDAKREARLARHSPPHFRRVELGRGDARVEDTQKEMLRERELEKIAKRNNLRIENLGFENKDSLTNKIAAWGALRSETAIARPDGLGTGNAHREGPNYRPNPFFGQRRPPLTSRVSRPYAYQPFLGPPRRPPTHAGSAAAAWQSLIHGRSFQPFSLAANSSMTPGRIPARSPIRTSARKSVVGSSSSRSSSPVRRVPAPHITLGPTYADQMVASTSKIVSEHAPPKPVELKSPKLSPKKSRSGLEASNWNPRSPTRNMEGSRWTGKLATASDPYFHSAPSRAPSRAPTPSITTEQTESTEAAESSKDETNSQTTEIAPGTPVSITATTAIDIEEYLELLDAEDEEENRYEGDPERLKRDWEINERVNRALEEDEEAVLARRILTERKVEKTEEVEDLGHDGREIGEMTVYALWDSFRDFVTTRMVTGFEEYVAMPRSMKPQAAPQAAVDEMMKILGEVEAKMEQVKAEVEQRKQTVEEKLEKTQQHLETSVSSVESQVTTPTADVSNATPTKSLTPIPEDVKNSSATVIQQEDISLPPAVTPPAVVPEPVAPQPVSLPTVTLHPVTKASAPKPVRPTTIQTTQIRLRPVEPPQIPKPKNKPVPIIPLEDAPPIYVANTWDMPTTPRMQLDIDRGIGDTRDTEADEFLLGLTQSKKTGKEPTKEEKKVVVIAEPIRIEEHEERKSSPEPKKAIPSTEIPVSSPVQIPGPLSFAAVATPAKPTIARPPSPQRSGVPLPIPQPPRPKPATKSPPKPIVAPKPVNLASNRKGNAVSPLVGGLVDPFLAGLEPFSRKQSPRVQPRPRTPSPSSDSADSTPRKGYSAEEKGKGVKITIPVATSQESTASTLVDSFPKSPSSIITSPSDAKSALPKFLQEVPVAGPSTPNTTTATLSIPPTPYVTPIMQSTTPAPRGRKLFTFELKISNSTISIPVYEMDDPRAVAAEFCKEHDLEGRLPDGKVTVEKIVRYFEKQFVERKMEREKRRAERRAKAMEQQFKSLV